MEIHNKFPELSLNIVLCLAAMCVKHGIKGHFGSKILLLELVCLFLELLERVDATIFETEFSCANQALGTMPVMF
jgi:hypothetical protein